MLFDFFVFLPFLVAHSFSTSEGVARKQGDEEWSLQMQSADAVWIAGYLHDAFKRLVGFHESHRRCYTVIEPCSEEHENRLNACLHHLVYKTFVDLDLRRDTRGSAAAVADLLFRLARIGEAIFSDTIADTFEVAAWLRREATRLREETAQKNVETKLYGRELRKKYLQWLSKTRSVHALQDIQNRSARYAIAGGRDKIETFFRTWKSTVDDIIMQRNREAVRLWNKTRGVDKWDETWA